MNYALELQKTIDQIVDSGIYVDFKSLKSLKGISCKAAKYEAIVIDAGLDDREARVVATHEKNHLAFGYVHRYRSVKVQAKFEETFVKNTTIREMVPLDNLIQLIETYPGTYPEEIANHFGVSDQMIAEAFKLYEDDEKYVRWIQEFRRKHCE